jgi:hypothetical protein
VVEEEFEHARASFPCRCSSKTFRATPTGQRLAKSLSDYVDGNFRGEFSGASELRDQVGRSLRAMVDTRNNRPMDHDPIAPHLLKPYRFSDQTGLRFAIAPERVEKVLIRLIRLRRVARSECWKSDTVAMCGFSANSMPRIAPRLEQDWLVIEQPPRK